MPAARRRRSETVSQYNRRKVRQDRRRKRMQAKTEAETRPKTCSELCLFPNSASTNVTTSPIISLVVGFVVDHGCYPQVTFYLLASRSCIRLLRRIWWLPYFLSLNLASSPMKKPPEKERMNDPRIKSPKKKNV